MIFSYQRTEFNSLCKLPPMNEDNLHEMSNLVFLVKIRNMYFKMSSAELAKIEVMVNFHWYSF